MKKKEDANSITSKKRMKLKIYAMSSISTISGQDVLNIWFGVQQNKYLDVKKQYVENPPDLLD